MAKLFQKLLLVHLGVFTVLTLIIVWYRMNIDCNIDNNHGCGRLRITLLNLEHSAIINGANCTNDWRIQHQIPINNESLFDLFLPNHTFYYLFHKIPKATFTYWLSHIYSQQKVSEKAYFSDKYLVKHYIQNYTKQYPQFNFIHYAEILCDIGYIYDNAKLIKMPSFEKLKTMKEKFNGFIVKPNHFSGKQIVISANDNFTHNEYKRIKKSSALWMRKKYKKIYHKEKKSEKINVEKWYELINPVVFIERKLNPIGHNFIEYKINVYNYKSLLLYVTEKYDSGDWFCNCYVLPEFKLLNITWLDPPDINRNVPIPHKETLNQMMKFSEHFAKREEFTFVRVDYYMVDNKIYFSEFTFAPKSGTAVISPVSFDYLLYDILCDKSSDNDHYDKIYNYIIK
eukprot:48368_1